MSISRIGHSRAVYEVNLSEDHAPVPGSSPMGDTKVRRQEEMPIPVKTVVLLSYVFPSGRMAIVLASFILAVQEILDLLYFALLFINDQTELNSLVAKNACYAPQGILHSSLS